MRRICIIALMVYVSVTGICFPVCAEEKKEPAKGLDMVSDTVATAFNKANALLAGKLDITMSLEKPNTKEQYTTNAIGQKVPKSTAVKSAGSLHNDQPL